MPLDQTFGDGDLIKGRSLAIEDRVHPSARANDCLQQRIELCVIFGDGVNQAAALASGTTSIPSRNLTPLKTFGN